MAHMYTGTHYPRRSFYSACEYVQYTLTYWIPTSYPKLTPGCPVILDPAAIIRTAHRCNCTTTEPASHELPRDPTNPRPGANLPISAPTAKIGFTASIHPTYIRTYHTQICTRATILYHSLSRNIYTVPNCQPAYRISSIHTTHPTLDPI